jgi:ubiquinone/menaquinone biosynthesis C-methylase UbiE
MSTESWQVETHAAQRYEDVLVPTLMAVWAPHLIDIAGIQPGDRVLDVACGTGIAAATAAERAGPSGSVVGLDLNPAMLAVAQKLRPGIEWRHGDAMELPFSDASFDRVICQFGLMFFPDRHAALLEARRVLRPGGVLAIATWAAIELSPLYMREADIVERLAGPEAAAIVRAPFVLPDPAGLERMLSKAGFETIERRAIAEPVAYASVDVFLEGEIDGTPLGAALHAMGNGLYEQVSAAVREETERFETPDGVVFPVTANVVSARLGS